MLEKMKQSGGDNSTNTQIETINQYGLGYKDVKDLCIDLIKDELSQYKKDAEATAIKRNGDLLNNFFKKAKEEKITTNDLISEFKNPDMQYGFINAQKSYIKVGTPELENMLSQLLIDRAKEKNRTLLQIVLNEAMEIAPLLLQQQLDILSLIFVLNYWEDPNVNSYATFIEYFKKLILPLISSFSEKQSSYQHIVYSKCGTLSIGEVSLYNIFAFHYKGLFFKGIPRDDLINKYMIKNILEDHPNFFVKCMNDPSNLQINAINKLSLDVNMTIKNIPKTEKDKLISIFNVGLMDEYEVKAKLYELIPQISKLYDIWENSQIKHLSLTSVGIILAASNIRNKIGYKFDLRLLII